MQKRRLAIFAALFGALFFPTTALSAFSVLHSFAGPEGETPAAAAPASSLATRSAGRLAADPVSRLAAAKASSAQVRTRRRPIRSDRRPNNGAVTM